MHATGARVVTDTVSYETLRGSTVDWEDTLVRTGFAISFNPNAAASCDCGLSFKVREKKTE